MAAASAELFHSVALPIAQLSLPAVLRCGQSFRWSVLPSLPFHEYRLCLHDRVVCLRQSHTTLFYRALFPLPHPHPAIADAETLVWINDYFQLNIDLQSLYRQWSARDPVFATIQPRFQGIRILRQDPWENLISFICSSNNNISRITKMVQALCSHFSPPLLSLSDSTSSQTRTYHPFPPPSVLAAPGVNATLRSLGFGYRADFIHRTAKMLINTHGSSRLSDDPLEACEKWLMALRNKSTTEAREELLKFVGVGRKVADCVLLMSLDKKEVVPVDTHVHQIAIKHYGLKPTSSNGKKVTMTPKIYKDVNTKLFNMWGDYAGWAHSVLFTADLKSFSTHGLDTPPESLAIVKQVEGDAAKIIILPTPPMTPSPLPLKRKRGESVVEISAANTATQEESSGAVSLAERVKARRRVRPTQ